MGQLLIGEILAEAALASPDGIGFTLGGDQLTFADAYERSTALARVLSGIGVKKGDVVVWWAAPELQTVEGFYGCALLGAIFCPLDPQSPNERIEFVLDYLGPTLIVTDATRAPLASNWARTNSVVLAVTGPTRGGYLELDELFDTDASTLGSIPDPSTLNDADPHVLYLTSGTTGVPKAVAVSHRASWLRAAPGGGAFAEPWAGTGGLCTCFPLFHYAGWHYVIEAGLWRVPVHLVRSATADELISTIERWRPSAFYAIPAVWGRILDPGYAGRDLTSLRRADTGTSPTSADLIERIRARVPNARTCVLYGSTEGGHTTTLAFEDLERKPGSVGRVVHPSTLRIEEDGEVQVRSLTLMCGYWRLSAQTDEVLCDGWYRTGDLGRIDEDGYLYLTGRRREVIRTGGETVVPSVVEAALVDHPAICDVAVVGVADDAYGEVVVAVVVLEEGTTTPSLESIRSHLEGLVAKSAMPRRVVVARSIPRTAATGQIQRSLLSDAILDGGPAMAELAYTTDSASA